MSKDHGTRVESCHYFPRWVTGLWLAIGLATLMFAVGCRTSAPVIDLGAKPPDAKGTLTGMVRGPEGTSPIAGRSVEIINTATGERRTAVTTETGAFTAELPAGKYRLEITLRDGETIVKRPGVVDLGHGDIDSHIEFVLGPVRIARPHGNGYRVDNGLGAPMA